MEEVLCNASTPKMVQGESLNSNSVGEGALNLPAKSSPIFISPVKQKICETSDKGIPNMDDGRVDCNSQTSNSFLNSNSEGLIQKSASPTLIEHAFNVMKNLFSPDKSKNKSPNVLSPSSQQEINSTSTCNNVLSKQSELTTSEKGTDIPNSVQPVSGENNSKDQMKMNYLGVMHTSLTLDSHNNTDDSFLTSVSLFDESFQSAVTHLDENGEVLKNGPRLTDDCFNSSRNLDLTDPYNDTLENSDYCLENITLKNCSFASEGAHLCNTSKDGNVENLNKTPVMDLGRDKTVVEKTEPETVFPSGVLKENSFNIPNENEMKEILHPSRIAKGDLKEENCHKSVDSNIDSNKVGNHEFNKSTDRMSQNKSFEERMNLSNASQPVMLQTLPNEISERKTLQGENRNDVKMTINEIEVPIEEKENFLRESLSTMSVVSTAGDAVEVDNMLLSLKSDDSATCTSSLTSLEGNDENATPITSEKQLVKEPSVLDECNFERKLGRNSSLAKSQDKTFSKSEQNSPEKLSVSSGYKLNKSDELVSRRRFSESPKNKRTLQEKENHPCANISLIKNSEAAENYNLDPRMYDDSNGKDNLEFKTILSAAPKTDKTDDYEHQNEVYLDQNETGIIQDDTISLRSQESYTILKVDKNLNRPVIPSLSNVDGTLSDDKFAGNINSTSSEFEGNNIEINSRASDVSTDYECSITSLKQSTPICEGNINNLQCDSTITFDRPAPLIMKPQELTEDVEMNISKPGLLGKAMQIFFSNEEPVSSAIPIDDSESLFSNSVESVSCHSEINKMWDVPPEDPSKGIPNNTLQVKKSPKKLNETFDKNSPSNKSPMKSKLNETFDKKSNSSPKFNQTFDKSSLGAGLNKLNQTPNKNLESPKPINLNQTFDKKVADVTGEEKLNEKKTEPFAGTHSGNRLSVQSHKLNETYDKSSPAGSNQTFVLETESSVSNVTYSKDVNNVKGLEESGEINKTFDRKEVIETKIEEDGDKVNKVSEKNTTSPQFSANGESFDDKNIENIDFVSHKELLNGSFVSSASSNNSKDQTIFVQEKLSTSPKFDPELAQLIKEQFTSTDIEKICSVVDDLSSMKLSSDILKASEQFDRSFHESLLVIEPRPLQADTKSDKIVDILSPQSFDFLNSIGGKPTGRDLGRESLYVKFDPLVQPSHGNSLIDFTKEVEALTAQGDSPATDQGTVCKNLLTISPEKQPDDIVPPLTPLSHKSKTREDEAERLKKLQNEIYFLKNLYAERERVNKERMEDFESQVAKLTGQNCILEDRLKESNEREKSLVKKLKEQTQNIEQFKVIMEEYIKVISKLTSELESLRSDSAKQIETLTAERDSYMTDLQNTEAAFTVVHAKYEKSKKMIVDLRANENVFKNTIAEQTRKIEEFKGKAVEVQEKALREYEKVQKELNEGKNTHTQETTRLRAQLRKTELKLEAMQETLDQKIKENQQLTAICDELIEGKK